MRKLLMTGLSTVAVAGGLIGLTAASADSATAGSDSAGHVQQFTVVEHAITDTVVDIGKPGDSLGDLLAFGNPIFNASNTTQIGSDQGSCVRTKVGQAWECSWTTTLNGGSLVVEGPYFDHADSVLAITGGTGVWRTARGQMKLHARNAAGSSYDFSFSVNR